MARTRELTWHKPRSRYRKVYKGQTYYLKTSCRNKSDDDGYRATMKEWQAVKAHADGEGPEPYLDGEWNPDDYAMRYARWLVLADERAKAGPPGNGGHDAHAGMATDYTRHAFTPGVVARIRTGDVPVTDLFGEYLRQRKVKAEAGKLSIKQYAQDKAKLADFQGFAEHHGKTMLSDIDGPFLGFYRECQEALTAHKNAAERVSAFTSRKRLQTVMKVWRWAYQNEYLDRLPRILDKGYATIDVERPKPQFWEVAELRKLFTSASQRTKLFILLAANCGYTQREISSLSWECVHPKERIIRRERPKTGQRQTHILWPLTWKLLQAESESQTGLCLMGQKGNELLTEKIRPDGNISLTDSISLAFNRTLKKNKLASTGRTFKHIRKTSANAISERYEDNRLVDIFLAHSTKGAMREHYAEQHLKKYFEAVEWLEGFYGFTE